MNRKKDSKNYYDKHHGNALARIGYWKHDHRYTVHVIEKRKMSIHHYPNPQLAVNEMNRILKKGGILCINDMDCIALVRWIANIAFPHMKSGDVKMYSREEIEDMVIKAGFKKFKYKKILPSLFYVLQRSEAG